MIPLRDTVCFPQFAGCTLKCVTSQGIDAPFYNNEGTSLGYELFADYNGMLHTGNVDGEMPDFVTVEAGSKVMLYDDDGNLIREIKQFNV